MELVDVVNRAAVRDDVAFEAPLPAQDVVKLLVGAARLAVGPVVGAHYSFRLAFDDGGAEGGQIGFLQIAFADDGVEAVPFRLGAAVYGEMLRNGDDLRVARIVALQA